MVWQEIFVLLTVTRNSCCRVEGHPLIPTLVVEKVIEILVRLFSHFRRRYVKRHQDMFQSENVVSHPLGYPKRKQWICSELKLNAHGSFGPCHVPKLTCCLQNLAHFASAGFLEIVTETNQPIVLVRKPSLGANLFGGFKRLSGKTG